MKNSETEEAPRKTAYVEPKIAPPDPDYDKQMSEYAEKERWMARTQHSINMLMYVGFVVSIASLLAYYYFINQRDRDNCVARGGAVAEVHTVYGGWVCLGP